jgi:hypothetical protein
MPHLHRRGFLQTGLAAGGLSIAAPAWCADPKPKREKLPVAAIVTEYRVNSHADVIVGKILEGWEQDGGPGPDLKLAALYTDQVPKSDISRALQRKHGFRLAKTIEEAITLDTGKVAVAGVLSIGEHGAYPFTKDTGQHMYPRRRFFDEIVAAFKKYGRVVPVFNDKHLAYAWADAKHMYDTARELKVPFMAGSSAPVAWRVPPLELPRDCQIESVLVHGYGGLESYGFHALDCLQCMVERRKGGETGIASVQAVKGEEIIKAEKEGRWSRELFEAAGDVAEKRLKKPGEPIAKDAVFYLIEYRDGLRAAVPMNAALAYELFSVAVKLKGEAKPRATRFELQDGKPYGHFAHLLRAIEHLIHTGKPPYPVERTLLATGVLDAAMHSMAEGHALKKTDPLKSIAYQPAEWPFAEGRAPKPREVP